MSIYDGTACQKLTPGQDQQPRPHQLREVSPQQVDRVLAEALLLPLGRQRDSVGIQKPQKPLVESVVFFFCDNQNAAVESGYGGYGFDIQMGYRYDAELPSALGRTQLRGRIMESLGSKTA